MLCDNVFEDVVSIYIVSILKVNRTWAQHSSGPYYVSACVCVFYLICVTEYALS